MCSCHSILECCVTFSGVKLSIRSFVLFVDYPLGQMRVGDKLWMNWNKAVLKLWKTQLNYMVLFCASSVCLWG